MSRVKTLRAMTLYHGTTHTDWVPHVGACLTDDEDMAKSYAGWRSSRRGGVVAVVRIALAGLVVDDRTDEVDRDEQSWPGDTMADIARLASEGVDVVTYDDEDEQGRELRCYRLVSARAVAAVTGLAGLRR